jgi:histidinol-phosphate/aromatic aminotransferase/cobyric acid decarboxylase-like protein
MDAIHEERRIQDVLTRIKREAGSHSPSVATILQALPEIKMEIDACFLSNPYATDLFLDYFRREVVATDRLRQAVEHYPSQNATLARVVAPRLGVPAESIFLGNGATEIIQAILHNFCEESLLLNLPTFSPYYEFVRPGTRVIYHTLRKEEAFQLDLDRYLRLIEETKPNTVVLINPNNPDGGYLPQAALHTLLAALRAVPNVIVDESFIHFAFETAAMALPSCVAATQEYANLIVVKSMSKDFGIAGLRIGYAVMAPARVQQLLGNGFLWNLSGFAEYFLELWARDEFSERYEVVRRRYIQEAQAFFQSLRQLPGIHVYPSLANYALLELRNGMTAFAFVSQLLVRHGIYTRNCEDKKGLVGEFVRIGARTAAENAMMIQGIQALLGQSQVDLA